MKKFEHLHFDAAHGVTNVDVYPPADIANGYSKPFEMVLERGGIWRVRDATQDLIASWYFETDTSPEDIEAGNQYMVDLLNVMFN